MSDFDDNRSMWAATSSPPEPSPPLRGDVLADVVIIGGGFTGVSTAWQLSRRFPERSIVLLEARRIGNGASGRNGGMALNWVNGVESHDRERALRVYNATRLGMDLIDEMIRENGLSVRFRRDGCLESYTDAARAEHAHAKAEKLQSWGIPTVWLGGGELRDRVDASGVVGAVLDPTAGQLHGLDLLYGMVPVLQGRGVRIFEGSPVRRIDEGAVHVVHTDAGTVKAPVLVLATNGYTAKLGYFRSGLLPLHSHVLATEPRSPAEWAALGWRGVAGFTDDLDRIAYASMTPDGRLLFGGGGNLAYSYLYGGRTAWDREPTAQYEFIHSILRRYFPRAADVPIAHRWTGTLGTTMHRVCSMGVTGAHRNVFHALGYSGHGVVLANLAGLVLTDLIADHHEPWRDLPFYQRALGGIPPEPLRSIGYHVFTRLTGRSPRTYEVD